MQRGALRILKSAVSDKRMKRAIALTLTVLFTLTLAACAFGGTPQGSGATEARTEAPNAERVTLSASDSTEWTCVLANGLSSNALSATTALTDAFRDAGAKAPARVYDNDATYTETAREILIGNTNRAQTAAVREELGAGEVRIAFRDTKLVVLAANDWLLGVAVRLLPTLWSAEDGRVTVPASLSVATDRYAADCLPLLDGENRCVFRVVYSADAELSLIAMVKSAATDFKRALGCRTLTVVTDAEAEDSDAECEILVGPTNRAASTEAMASISGLEGYRLLRSGKKLVLVASSAAEYRAGLAALTEKFTDLAKGAVVGVPMLENDYATDKLTGVLAEEWYLAAPKPAGATVLSTYADRTACMTQATRAEAADFTAYLADLAEAGLTVRSETTQGENRYALAEGEKTTAWVEYLAASGILRVYLEKAGTCRYPEVGETGENNPYETVLWQLPVDNLGTRENGGMSYVFRLGDGTFFLIDGSYNTQAEADRLYEFLVSKTPEGMETVISGWFVSHLHWDHYGALMAFAKYHAADVDVRAFYCHFDPPDDLLDSMRTWKRATRYTRLHTGMEWNLPGFTASVLYTHEDILPDRASNPNDQSTVLRVTVNGQRVLFLGDAQKTVSEWLLRNQTQETLSADVVQLAHHGYEGGTVELYDAIGAHTVLWPLNILSNQESYGGLINVFAFWVGMKPNGNYAYANYHVAYEMSCVKKILVAGAGVAELHFPYTPQGDKLPDHGKIYEDQLKKYQG
ncbi:MAG TPA: hypothetical protein DDW30_02955 [Clostridiales bacterium]|nr:hypothetical protein [Clostridiales bacterium]